MNFYQHFIGDYDRDTKDLSLLEHGAYRRLLDHNYATEQPIPNDLEKLYRIAGARTQAECKAVRVVADRFFAVNGDGRRHNVRAEEEIGKYNRQLEHNRAVGRLGGRPRKKPGENPGDNPEETRGLTRSGTREEPVENPHHNHKPEESNTSTAGAVEVRGAAANVPNCPHEKLIALYHELLPTCPKVVEWNEERQRLMRARWREQSQPNGKRPGYTDEAAGLAFWHRYFFYVSQSEFLTGKAEPSHGRTTFVATLEWLIRPKNFAKTVEGAYHR